MSQALTEGLLEFLIMAHLRGEHEIADTSTEVGARETVGPEERVVGCSQDVTMLTDRDCERRGP